MAIQGLRGTGTFDVTSGIRPKNWREGILLLYPNGAAPLTALTSVMSTESVDDPEFSWFEKQFATRRLELGANVSGTPVAGDTGSITILGSGAYIEVKKGMILMLEQTGELVRVSADPTSNTITVIRGWGLTIGTVLTGITFNGIGINPKLVVIGSAYPEGDMPPKAIAYDPTKKFNFTQIFREKIGFTRTAMKTRLRTGDAVKEARREALEQHSIELERAFIWGKPAEIADGGNGQPLRSTGGIVHFIDQAIAAGETYLKTDFGGNADMYEMEAAIEAAFRYGSNEKMLIGGNQAILAINQVIRKNTSWTFENAKEYGMNMSRVVTPFGTIAMKTHPLFNVMSSGTTGGTAYNAWISRALILDMGNIKYRPLKDSDTKYLPDVQANGLDGKESEYLTECGFEIRHAKTHSYWVNLVKGVADT